MSVYTLKMVGKKVKHSINYGYFKNDLYIMLDRHCIYRIPEKYNPFSSSYLFSNIGTPLNIDKFTEVLYQQDRLSLTNHIDIDDKMELLLFRNDKIDIWIDKSYLKLSDYGNNTRVYGKDNRTPLYFCESNEDVFDYLILPVIRKEVNYVICNTN